MPRGSEGHEPGNEAEEGGWRAMLHKTTRENLSDTVTCEQIFEDERHGDPCGDLGRSHGCAAGRGGVPRAESRMCGREGRREAWDAGWREMTYHAELCFLSLL